MSMFKKVLFAAAASLVAICSAKAQVVLQASSVQLQPQIGRDQDGFKTCGLRAVVVVDRHRNVEAYDFSLNVYHDFLAMAKAGKSASPKKAVLEGQPNMKPVLPAPVNFWIAGEADSKPLMPVKVVRAETSGYILAGLDFVRTFETFMDMAQGKRMQFVVRYKSEPVDNVIAFGASLPEVELTSLHACVTGLHSRMQVENEARQ